MRSLFSIVFTFLISTAALCSDSTETKRIPKYARKHFVFSFDTRNSFVRKERAKIFGLKFGLEYDDKFRAGLGFYFLTDSLGREIRVKLPNGNDYQTVGELQFNYFGPYYERILFHNYRWEFTASMVLGAGSVSIDYFDPKGNEHSTKDIGLWVIEPSLQGHYKFFRWVGVGAGIGYRSVFFTDKLVNENLNSPIYIIKLKLFIGEIYKMMFKEGKKKKEK